MHGQLKGKKLAFSFVQLVAVLETPNAPNGTVLNHACATNGYGTRGTGTQSTKTDLADELGDEKTTTPPNALN